MAKQKVMQNEIPIMPVGIDKTIFSIRTEQMSEVFTKYHIDFGCGGGCVLHRFTGIEANNEAHDHPWGFRSVILKGSYLELAYEIKDYTYSKWTRSYSRHKEGSVVEYAASHIHKIIELPEGECWTMVQRINNIEKKPGFYKFEEGEVWFRFWDEPEFKLLTQK